MHTDHMSTGLVTSHVSYFNISQHYIVKYIYCIRCICYVYYNINLKKLHFNPETRDLSDAITSASHVVVFDETSHCAFTWCRKKSEILFADWENAVERPPEV